MTTSFIEYAGEQSKVRFWQESAIAAMQVFLTQAKLPRRGDNETDDSFQNRSRRVAEEAGVFAFEVAEVMFKQHGPSVATALERENPFIAIESGGIEDEEGGQ
jgi:hypothetical protein